MTVAISKIFMLLELTVNGDRMVFKKKRLTSHSYTTCKNNVIF